MKSPSLKIVALVFMSALWEPARPYATGPPMTEGTCTDMNPFHPNYVSKDRIVFNYTDPLCYTPGKSLNVTILRAEIEGGKDVINGIMVQANKPDVNTVNFGTFEVKNTDKLKASECLMRPKSVLSHITKLNQSTITFYWMAPSSDEGDLQFRITLVFTYEEFKIGLKIPLPICTNITQQSTEQPSTEPIRTTKEAFTTLPQQTSTTTTLASTSTTAVTTIMRTQVQTTQTTKSAYSSFSFVGTTATINNPGLSYLFLLHLLNFFRH